MSNWARLAVRGARVAATIMGMGAVLSLSSCDGGYSGPTESIAIGVPPLEQNALLYIAADQGLFTRNGLHVTVKDYPTGVATLSALARGDVDIAEAAEFPVIGAVLRGQQVSIIASNDKFENGYIVARKDRGIADVADLKGKRIGVARGTIPEFYLGRFLQLHGMSVEDVSLVDVQPASFVETLTGGSIDAIAAWQPYVHQMLSGTGLELVSWSAHSDQAAYGVLVTNSAWAQQHAGTVRRLLTSLASAEDYLVRHPAEAKAIVQKRLGYDDVYMAAVWPEHHFSLALDFSLVAAMNDEARWLVEHSATNQAELPDIREYLYLDGLRAIRPRAVNIAP